MFAGLNYFKGYYKMIATDLSKQQALDVDPKAIQQINFTLNVKRDGNKNATMLKNYWKNYWRLKRNS